MGDMVRKQIYLKKRQVKAIQQKAEVMGINESELIRQAIDRDLYGGEGLPTRPDPAAWEEIESFLSLLDGKPQEGKPYHFDRNELYEDRLSRFDDPDSD
jgi:hypothetical protein